MTTFKQNSILWENQQEQWQRLIEACVRGLQHESWETKNHPAFKAGSLDCLSYIVENNRSAIAILDRCLNYVYANQRYLEEYKLSGQNIIGKSIQSLFPEFPQKWYEAYQMSLAGEVINVDYDAYIRPDGNEDWTSWECRPWHEPDGSVGGIIVYTEMITARKKAELAMREKYEFYQSIYDKSPFGIALIDSVTGQVHRANARFNELIGYNSPGHLMNLAHPYELLQDQDDLVLFFAGKINCISSINQIDRADGSRTWVSIKVTPSGSEGRISSNPCHLWMIEDISEYKRKEEELLDQSSHDVLTGLYNRTRFDTEINRLDKDGQLPLSVIIGDINGLKLINDAFGHAAGDKLLVDTAIILEKCCRPNDFLARIGGDEFCILLPGTDSNAVTEILSQIKTISKDYENKSGAGARFLSISLGYGIKTRPGEPLDDIVRTAEDHMLRRKILEQQSLHNSLLSSIKATMHEKSHETREHGERLAELARHVGKMLDLSDSQLQDLELLSNVHDIGKIIIDDKILNKSEALTDQEWVEMKKHPDIGYRIAQASPDIRHISESILCHHERWDGKGYPQGLAGETIPMFARILAIVDAYDAMTNDRAYRKALSVDFAVKEILKNAGKQFDPYIAGKFAKMMDDYGQTG